MHDWTQLNCSMDLDCFTNGFFVTKDWTQSSFLNSLWKQLWGKNGHFRKDKKGLLMDKKVCTNYFPKNRRCCSTKFGYKSWCFCLNSSGVVLLTDYFVAVSHWKGKRTEKNCCTRPVLNTIHHRFKFPWIVAPVFCSVTPVQYKAHEMKEVKSQPL